MNDNKTKMTIRNASRELLFLLTIKDLGSVAYNDRVKSDVLSSKTLYQEMNFIKNIKLVSRRFDVTGGV